MALKIIATGDIHIGRSSSAIQENTEISATKNTWIRIVEWSISNQVDIVVLTGDIIDRDNRYFEAIGPLQAGFEKLKAANISVYMVAGNHDYDVLPQIITTKKNDNVHLLGMNGKWELKTFSKEGKKIQFVGWSFPNRYVSEDPLKSFSIDNLDPNIPTIGLVHGEVDTPDGRYAPIDSNGFRNKPVDVWILGHIHKHHFINEGNPKVFYPGSPHALSPKETGNHTPLLLTVSAKDDINIQMAPLVSPVRYENISIDITGSDDKLSLLKSIVSGIDNDANSKIKELESVSFLVYDITLTGQHGDIKKLEEWIEPLTKDYNPEIETETKLSVRKVITENIKPKVENLEELAKQTSPVGILAKAILAIQNGENSEFIEGIQEKWVSSFDAMNTSGTYKPIQKHENIINSPNPKQYILNECNRLLGELITQQSS
ncbi:MAG TPA: DNA repair exonuclease [Bacteroidales bacterium]|jgi:DNA repair exonuclease SbcCD nuclease subunit|nr:DNA repair exonuclease [Bacteroidales bacterium]